MFVQPQFRTRYSGHTLSRLGDFGHNMTKQGGFPTVRRRGSDKVKPSMACVLHWSGGGIVEHKVETLENSIHQFKYAFCRMLGWLVNIVPNQ
jgi:hypothetical protein